MTPGWKTSEGRLAAIKAAIAAGIALCTVFGWGVPAYLNADAPWVASAALLAGVVISAVYTVSRTGLKKSIAAAEKIVVQGAQGDPGPMGNPGYQGAQGQIGPQGPPA